MILTFTNSLCICVMQVQFDSISVDNKQKRSQAKPIPCNFREQCKCQQHAIPFQSTAREGGGDSGRPVAIAPELNQHPNASPSHAMRCFMCICVIRLTVTCCVCERADTFNCENTDAVATCAANRILPVTVAGWLCDSSRGCRELVPQLADRKRES